MNTRPLFSILHTSARPDAWRKVFDAWMSAAANPADVEYVLCVDSRWGFKEGICPDPGGKTPDCIWCWNNERDRVLVWNETPYQHSGYVSGVNLAAKASHGQILIVVADDQFPCESWDRKILETLLPISTARRWSNSYGEITAGSIGEPWVLEVSTGTPDEHERGIMVMPILSRARYKKLGYVFYPEYESMFADNDFCEHAREDGIVIDARNLMFEHRHPLRVLETKFPGRPVSKEIWDAHVTGWDSQYQAQHSQACYTAGRRILHARRVAHFDVVAPSPKRIIAIVLPGDSFGKEFLGMILGLQQWLCDTGWAPFVHQAASSVVYFTRQMLLESVLAQDPIPEYVLWLDHDNLLSREHFKLLLEDLELHPDLDSVAGWYWIDNHDGSFSTSVGIKDSSGQIGYAGGDIAQAPGLVDCAWHGFGAVLMRFACLQKAGEHPFLPVMMPEARHRMTGEDVSFCLNASQRGNAKFVIDPRVNVAHLKIGMIQPVPKIQAREPVIVGTIRAKNAARDIARCIESIQRVCPTVLVLDDHSTDNTAAIAESLGATVYASAFPDRDDGRDHDFLLQRARKLKADWIFAIDSDEALDARDIPALVNACLYSDVDALHLRWMNLWNSETQVRVDGIWGKGSPPRLWRVTPSLQFTSMSAGVHAWPVGNVKRGFVDVRLWHWGNMRKEDRIRKYHWYNAVDPGNASEDFYRHVVQGDIPEIPADVKLDKAGPLQLQAVEPYRHVPGKIPGADVPGWMTEAELLWLFETAKDTDSIIEVGSYKGRSTTALAMGCKGLVTAVDTFRGTALAEDAATVRAAFQENTEKLGNVKLLCDSSERAARLCPSVDMVFIDAEHTYEDVKADLLTWLPKAKKLICGHDYNDPSWPGVKQAVDEILGPTVQVSAGTIWSFQIASSNVGESPEIAGANVTS